MNIVYIHGSRFGNGREVADEFRRWMAEHGVDVDVRHVREVDARALPHADLYVFSSPGRLGRPLGAVRRFLGRVQLPPGTRYGLLTTEMGPQPNQQTGVAPSEEKYAEWERVRPIMKRILENKGLILVAEDRIRVTAMRGPLEDGWQERVHAFGASILSSLSRR